MHGVKELGEHWVKISDLADNELEFKIRALNDEEFDALNNAIIQGNNLDSPPKFGPCYDAFVAAVSDWKGLEEPYSEKTKRGSFATIHRANRIHIIKMVALKLWREGFLTEDERKNL